MGGEAGEQGSAGGKAVTLPCNAIVRIWVGRVPLDKADEYEGFLVGRAIPDYTSVDGNLGGMILRRDAGEYTEFMIITFWQSIDSIKAFAGEDYEKAKYYEEDREYLLDFPEHVTHYRIVECFQGKALEDADQDG